MLGTVFTVLNLKVSKWRRRVITPRKWLRVLDVVVIMCVYATLAVFIPAGFDCVQATGCYYSPYSKGDPQLAPEGKPYMFGCDEVSARCCVVFLSSTSVMSLLNR